MNSRISEAEEWISELKDKMVEITSEEQNKVKRMKGTEESLRVLWDNQMHHIWTREWPLPAGTTERAAQEWRPGTAKNKVTELF